MWLSEEGPPGRRWRLLRPDHVFLDRRLRDANAQLGELPDDARGAPARVRRRHLADEILDRLVHRWSAVPCTNDGDRLDEDQGIPPAKPGPGQPRPEQSIGDLGAGPGRAPLVDGELVAQREDLELEGGARSEASAERREEGEEDCLHEACRLPHLGGTQRESLAAVAFRETLLMRVASPF